MWDLLLLSTPAYISAKSTITLPGCVAASPGPPYLPNSKVAAALQVTLLLQVAIAEQHWVLGLVSLNAGRVASHHI